jgi:anti-sigma B factor antagonist
MTEPPVLWTGTETAQFSVIETRKPPGYVVLTVAGDIDLRSRDQFTAALRYQPVGAAWGVIVDLSGVSFCDARGVGELLSLRERARQRDIPVHLVVTSTPVRRCLATLGLPVSPPPW